MARAQRPAMPLIGFLSLGSAAGEVGRVAAFKQGLSQAGYVEGQNIAIEYRYVAGQYDRLPALSGDLVSRKPAVIFAAGPRPSEQSRCTLRRYRLFSKWAKTRSKKVSWRASTGLAATLRGSAVLRTFCFRNGYNCSTKSCQSRRHWPYLLTQIIRTPNPIHETHGQPQSHWDASCSC